MQCVEVRGGRRAWRAQVPETGLERMRGLLGREELGPGQALLLPRARSVHTIGMRFPIRVAWLDAAGVVIDVRRLRPGRITRPRSRACAVLECRQDADVRVGDIVRVLPWEDALA